jgi:hypothetical protein
MSYVERRRFLWILLIAAIVLLSVVAKATTLSRLRFEELAQQSTAVARLRCLGAESRWEGGEIWTETRFELVELNKGLLGGIVTVRLLGGRSGSLHSRVDGVPVFRPGEEVYLFLWGKPDEAYRVLGWSQGTFRIVRDDRTGEENVTQESAMTAGFNARSRELRREAVRRLPVGVFREKLRRALEQNGQ